MVAKLAPLALAILAALTLTEPALIDEVVEADLDAVAYVRSPREGAPTSATLLLRALPRLAGALNVSVSSPTAPAGWQQRSVAVVPGGGTMAVAPVSRLTILLAGWPDGDHVVTLSAFHPPHVVNSSMVRWLRVATTPPPPQPPATLYIEPGLTIPMVDQHWLASSSGLRRHTEQPPLLPITNASFGTELGYVPYETLLSLAATRDGNGVAARFTLNNDGNRSAPERIVSCHSDATGDHWSCEYESPAAVHLAFKLRTRASDQPPVNPFDACKSCRLYNNQTDGPVNLSHIIIGWPWAPYNCSGCGMTLPMRTAWPALLRPESGACLLLRDTPLNGYNTTRLAAMQAGKIPGSFADSGDNFGGAYLMPGGKRYVLLQERLIARFPPLRVAYDNLNGLTRTNVAWTTTDGIEWTPSFAMPEPRAQCTRADVLPGEANCSLYGWQQYGTVAPGLPGHGQPQLWQEKGSLLLGYVQDFGSGIARYHLSLMSSRDGLFWQRVSDPAHGHTGVPTINSTADGVMVPNGAFHSWDGGLTAPPAYTGSELQSVGGSVTVGEYMFEPMNFVSNRAHFIVETRHADVRNQMPTAPSFLCLRCLFASDSSLSNLDCLSACSSGKMHRCVALPRSRRGLARAIPGWRAGQTGAG
jgi:hypothetical protein